MAMNPAPILTPAQWATTHRVTAELSNLIGAEVVINHVKRDGTDSTLNGVIVDVIGTDKPTVKVETDRGFRSANVWLITSYEVITDLADCTLCGDTGTYSVPSSNGIIGTVCRCSA